MARDKARPELLLQKLRRSSLWWGPCSQGKTPPPQEHSLCLDKAHQRDTHCQGTRRPRLSRKRSQPERADSSSTGARDATPPGSRDPGWPTPGAGALSARSREAAPGRGARPGARSSPSRAAGQAAPTPRASHMERWTESAAAGSGASVARSAGPSRSCALLLRLLVRGHHGVQ